MYIISDSEDEKNPPKIIHPTVLISDSESDIFHSSEEFSSSPMKDSYSSLKMMVDDKENEGRTFDIPKNKSKKKSKNNKFDFEESKNLNDKKLLKKRREKVKKEAIIKKIFEESESRNNTSDVEELTFENQQKEKDDGNLEKSENEKRISDYIKQKFGNRKRKKNSKDVLDNNEKEKDFISDFFDRGDKRKTKHYKPTPYTSKKDIIKKEKDAKQESDIEEMKDIEDIKDIVDIKDIENIESRENKKSKKTEINNSMEEKRTFENIDELLSLEDEDSENEDIKPYSLKNDTKTDSDNDYEDIKNSINNLVPSVISEINKELDTQKALLDENTIEIETPIINDIKKKGDKSTKNDYSIKDLTEDDEDDVDMSSLGIYKKIHITFYGYKLLPNQQFARIYPITLEVPETAKFKTVFKAYCAGTQLNEDDMLFNYNNIEIFSTSTLKGLDMTSSLENYRIDVFYRVEYPTYKHQLIVKQINDEELQQKEKEQKKMEFEFNTKFINDDEGLSDRNINIIVQDNNKNEVKILINKNKTIKQLGLAYLEKSSLDKSLISKLLFYFDGQKLDNCQTLKEIDIENQDIIDLKINK